jgi:outer membrane PBP1 activator LpoA protein
MNYPGQIALLLPLTGGKRPEAEAIREGFLAAHFGLQGLPAKPRISIYDTGRLSPVEAYRRAILDGADFVVGPLLKESVTAVAAEADQTTTLALNFLPNNRKTPRGFYQFALWSEDEAHQAAERAVAEGRSKAVALAADSDWGRRMLTSFAAELESRDGQLLDSALYDVRSPDFSSAIQRAIRGLLLLDESFARHERLAVNLGQKLTFEPRRREDVDFIFIAANAKNGIRIRPQLKYDGAGNIPTYATSHIFEVGSTNNSDLDGIMFPDIPWLIEPDPTARELQQTLAQYWAGQADRHSRFYAMGYDTYRVIPFLNGEVRSVLAPVAGMTGQLTMDDNRRIHRTLSWARIERGKLVPLPDLPTPLAGDI